MAGPNDRGVSHTRALGNNYGAVTDGRGATVALFHPSAAAPPTQGSHLKRRARTTRAYWTTSPTTSGRLARTTNDSGPFYRTVTKYSPQGFLTVEGNQFRGLIDQGFEAWPIEGSTGAPDRQSQGLHGCAIQATLEHGVRDILRSIQGQSRVPSRGILSRESFKP